MANFHLFKLPEQGNKLFPLPPDYLKLDENGKRMARVNAARVRVPGRPDLFVRSWLFFRKYYLCHPDAYWYDDDALKPAPYHIALATIRASKPLACLLGPRRSGKSFTMREFALMDAVALPRTRIGIVKATDRFVTLDFQRIIEQLTNNQRLIDDFGVLKPKKGEGLWNHDSLKLTNGSSLLGMSVTGKLRGNDFHYLAVDDPEDDKEFAIKAARSSAMAVSRQRLHTNFETLLFNKLMRMRSARGVLMWLGTMIDTRSFIYRIVTEDDPRFARWHRERFDGEAASGESIWPAKWSRADLDEMRADLGEDAYRREHRNLPGTTASALFSVSPEKHYYRLAEPDGPPPDLNQPLRSTVEIQWNDCAENAAKETTTAPRREKFGDWVSHLTRVITVDYALPGITHDFSAIHTAGIDPRNNLWSLDLWVGKATSDKLLSLIWDMARRWMVRVIGVESYGLQEEFYGRVRDMVANQGMGSDWIPQCVPIAMRTGVSKPERIGALEPRFRTGQIKFPSYRLRTEPYLSLMWQIGAFTYDLRGMDHDDAIDALAMTQSLVKFVPQQFQLHVKPETPLDMLRAGRMEYAPGIPVAGALNACDIPYDIVEKMMAQQHRDDAIEPGEELEPA